MKELSPWGMFLVISGVLIVIVSTFIDGKY